MTTSINHLKELATTNYQHHLHITTLLSRMGALTPSGVSECASSAKTLFESNLHIIENMECALKAHPLRD